MCELPPRLLTLLLALTGRSDNNDRTVRIGLKRGKLLYLFQHPPHDVERDKHRNVITRARFIKLRLEAHGFRLIPWDFKKGQPPRFWDAHAHARARAHARPNAMDDDDDLYGSDAPQQPDAPATAPDAPAKPAAAADESADEPMDEESADDDASDDSDDSDSASHAPICAR